MKDAKRLARRAMATFLALMMFTGYVPQFIMELGANPIDMTLSLSDALVAGGEITPRFVENGGVEGQATVSWHIPNVGQMDRLVFPLMRRWVPDFGISGMPGFVAGHYVNDIAVVHVLRTADDEIFAEYRVFGGVNATMNGSLTDERTNLWPNFRTNIGTPGPDDDYRYLSDRDPLWMDWNSHIEPIITPPTIFNPNRIVSPQVELITSAPAFNRPYGGPAHDPGDPNAGPPIPPTFGPWQQPMFRITPGGGFSFTLQPGAHVDQAAAHSVHFLWDEQVLGGTTFRVTTGGLLPGAFYDFVLSRSLVFDAINPTPPVLVPVVPPTVPPSEILRMHYIGTYNIASQAAFTGFVSYTVPLAEHREAPQDAPFTLNRPDYFDYLWWTPNNFPPATPTDGTLRDDFLLGFTNWELPGAPRPTVPTISDPLWHPWNILDHTHPVHGGLNDFLPGFAGTRAIQQPNFEPQRDYPTNMLRYRIEVPWRFHPGAAAPIPIPQGWMRVDPDDFAAMQFNINIDLQIPPNIPNSFAVSDLFGTPVRTDPGTPPFIALDRTRTRAIMDGVQRHATDIYILGLEPSRVFPHFNLEILPPSMGILRPGMADVIAGDSQGDAGRFWVDNVHTFLEFDVVFIGGRFHVRIFPFADAHGDYTVITNNQITAPHRSSGRDVIFIPLEPSGPPSFVQVRFHPTMPGMRPLYSQVMAFVPVSDRHIFTEPANFVLQPDNPPLTFLEPSNTEEAIFSVDVGWDLATVRQLELYFNEVNAGRGPANSFGPGVPGWVAPPGTWTPPRGAIHIDPSHPDYLAFIGAGGVSGGWFLPQDELIFTYILWSRLSPFDAEGRPFAFVDVTVTRVFEGTNSWFEWDYVITEYVDPPVFQVLAPTPPATAVPVPSSVFVTKTGNLTHQAWVLDQFGRPMTPTPGTFEWSLNVTGGGAATINDANGTITPANSAVPPTAYTVTVDFTGDGVNFTGSLNIANPVALVPPTSVDITSTYDTAFQGSTRTFTADVTPAAALQNVRWEVTDTAGQPVAGATITQGGVLFVANTVEPNLELRVRAITTSFGQTHFDDTTVRVVVAERSVAITDVTRDTIMRIGIGGANGLNFGGGVRLNMIASRQGATTPPLPHFFQFPEIYHITAQLFDINANDNRDEPITPPLPESNAQPMTLDHPVELDFPPPQNLRATIDPADEDDDDILGGFFDLSFDVSLSRIRHYIQTSPRRGADNTVTLRVFLGESQEDIQAIAGMNGAARAGAATSITVGASANGVPQTLDPFSDSGNLAALRNGTVMFEMQLSSAILHSDDVTLSQILKLHGLDRNRQYFVTMDAYIVFDTNPPYTAYSTTTNIAGVTTMGDLAPPDPGGMRPSAPRDLRVDDITVSSADLSWLPVPPLTPEGGQIRYQILRMRADQLPNELLDRRDYTMTEVLAEISGLGLSNPEAILMTQGSDVVLHYSGGVAAGFSLRHGTLTDDPADNEERVIFVDGTLSPNTLYFYYVRTVWDTPGGMTYSAWVGASVTTSLVEPPDNLRIELAPWIGGVLWMDFDPRFQFVIRFDAPVGSLDGHGVLYDFQYSLMTGADAMWGPPEWLTTAMQLERIPTPGREGFYQFTYLISGLNPGTQYSIRVRTADLINGDYSMYSNIATTRTDSDQDAINRDRDLQNLHQYLRDLIAEFLRRHHWTAQDSNNVFSAVYRPSMINNLLETNGSMIRLAMTGQDINVYYLPQALFLRTWQSEQGFIIAKGDMEISIPSHAFNAIDSEAILQAQQRIRDVPGVLDYYVRITAVMRDHANDVEIHGREPVGLEIVLGFELIEASTTAAQLDDDILTVLTHRLNTDYYTAPFIEEIIQMLDREESFEDMVRRLHQMADVIMNQMAAYVNSQLLPTLDRIYEVHYVSQPVTIRLINQPNTAVVNGFRFAGTNWVQQEVNIQGAARSMRTSGAGAFAFNIQNLNLPGVSQMQGNETLTALFVRYGLHDFLGTDATFDLNNNITLSQVQGIAARLAGAPHATNPQNWLRGQGYIVPVRGASSPATTQEAIYTLMAMYEIRSNTNVAGLRISNFNAASGITGIDARFRPAIQAAFELGLYDNANMNPTAPITVNDVLRMILAINQRVPL